ncbi:MAG TPA: hypothetical protein VEB66_01705 [Opitutaceae bacterium]|nr:hypothetical protein [Opitutaceae bacterium]
MKWKILTGVAAVAAWAVILVVRTDRARRIHEHNARLDTRAGKVAAEPWTRIETDSFVIYSDAPQAVLPLARDLEMLHRATESLAVRPAFKSGSTIVVLPSARSQWRTLAAARPARGPVRRTRSGVGDLIVVDGDWRRGPGRASSIGPWPPPSCGGWVFRRSTGMSTASGRSWRGRRSTARIRS